MSEVCDVVESAMQQDPGRVDSEIKEQHFGQVLAARRQALKLSQGDMAERLRLHPRQIAALESADFSTLPEFAFVRGYVRNYARALDLEAQPLLLNLLQLTRPGEEHSADENGNDVRAEKASSMSSAFVASQLLPTQPPAGLAVGRGFKYGVAALLGATAVAIVAYGFLSMRAQPLIQSIESLAKNDQQTLERAVGAEAAGEQQNAEQEAWVETLRDADTGQAPSDASAQGAVVELDGLSEPIAQTAALTAAAKPIGPPVLELNFRGRTWYDLTQGDGQRLVSQIVDAGHKRQFSGAPPYHLRVTTGAAISVRWRGQPVVLGAPTGNDAYVTMTLE